MESNIVFSLPKPYIVEMKNKYLKDFIDFKFNNNKFIYRFNHDKVKKYPIIIDPSFEFNTSVKNFGGVTYGIFDNENSMIVTGDNTAEKLWKSIAALEPGDNGKVSVLSDDVLFESDLVLLFTETMVGKSKVAIQRSGKSSVDFHDVLFFASTINGEEVVYSRVDVDIPFIVPGTIDINCTFPDLLGETGIAYLDGDVNLTPYTFFSIGRGYPVSFNRKFTYLPKIDISFDRNINMVQAGTNRSINIRNLSVRNVSSFKPISYSIIPYILDYDLPLTWDIMDDSETFKVSPHSISRNSYKYLTTLFDLEYSTVPVPSPRTYDASDWLGVAGGLSPIYDIGIGNLRSFVNKIGVVLHSAVNDRDNMEQGIDFLKQYSCISNEDIVVKKVGSSARRLKNIELKVFIKPFMYFILDQGVTFEDYFSYCSSLSPPIDSNPSITENSDGNTEIVFGTTVLKQMFTGSGSIIHEGITYTYGFDTLSENILANCSMVVKIDGRIFTFKILENTEDTLVIKGRRRNSLIKSNSFCILLFDPDRIFFKNSSFNYGIEIEKEDINSDGTLSYKTTKYDTDIKTGVEEIGFREERKDFTIIKPVNLFTIPSLSG